LVVIAASWSLSALHLVLGMGGPLDRRLTYDDFRIDDVAGLGEFYLARCKAMHSDGE
jgi:hypothetical protein